MHVIHEPSCLCHSPTLRPWIDFHRPTWRGFGARRSRADQKKSMQKQKQYFSSLFVSKHGGTFLSQAGPHSRLALSQAEHLPFS
jgi:hypothetical protein